VATKKSKSGKQAETAAKLGEFEQHLPCRLSQNEELEIGQRLAKAHEDLATHDAHAKSVRDELKAAETRLLEESSRLASILRHRSESRPVLVEQWADYARGVYYERRTDTQQQVPGSERPLKPEERQGVLRLDTHRIPPVPPTLDDQAKARQKELEQRADALLGGAGRAKE
jgi:hypothetical protein